MTTELMIKGMSCGHCVKAVQQALQAVPGVQSAVVNLAEGQATVRGEADPQALITAVVAEGYEAQVKA